MEKKEIEIPLGPYQLKTGSHAGEYIEGFIFKNSDYLFHVRSINRRPNDMLNKQLNFIFEAGNLLSTQEICPFCKKNTVKFFLHHEDFLLTGLTCCSENGCRMELKNLHPGIDLLPFCLYVLGSFKNKDAREKAEIFFKKVYGLPRFLTPQKVFNILKEAMVGKDLPIIAPPTKSLLATQLTFIF